MNDIIKSIRKTKLKSFCRPNPRKDYPPTYRPLHRNNKISKKCKNKVALLLQNQKESKARPKNFKDSETISDHFEDLISQLNNTDYSKSLCKLKNNQKEGNNFKTCTLKSKLQSFHYEASTSQEKGTMTEPCLSKKFKDKSSESAASVLQSISVNRKASLHAVAKSSSLSDMSQNLEEKDPISDVAKSIKATDSFEDQHNPQRSAINKLHLKDKLNTSDIMNNYFSDYRKSDEEIEYKKITPDFKGFSDITNNDSLDKETLVSKEVSADLDHPYSYSSPESLSNSKSFEAKAPIKDFPNFPFMSRSVFGSPSSSKSPPDILLHNDKINILRQMSQVFNDESKKKLDTSDTSEITNIQNNFISANNKSLNNVSDASISSVSNFNKVVDSHGQSNCQNEILINNVSKNTSNVKSNEKLPMEVGTTSTSKSSPVIGVAPVYLVSSHSLDKEESIKVKSYIGQRGEHVDIIDGFAFASFETLGEMNSYKDKPILKRKKKRMVRRLGSKIVQREYKSSGISELADAVKCSSSEPKVDKKESVLQMESDKCDPKIASESALKSIKSTENSRSSNSNAKDNTEKSFKEINTDLTGAFASNDLDKYLNEHSKLNISFPIPVCSITSKKSNIHQLEQKIKVFDSQTLQKSSNVTEKNNLCESSAIIISKTESVISKTKNLKVSHSHKLTENKGENREFTITSKDKGAQLLSQCNSNNNKHAEVDKKPIEIIYVYHSGRLLTLAGSLTKVNPSTSQNIKARVALPRGQQTLIEHAHKVAARKIKVVEINEDMAKFALSALKAPFKTDSDSSSVYSDVSYEGDKKITKKNILDILTAKLKIDKKYDWESEKPCSLKNNHFQSKTETEENFEKKESFNAGPNHKHSDTIQVCTTPSKVKWNQDDILKKTYNVHKLEQSLALKKNINRFPSLSREMKRLNMNYVQCSNMEFEKEDEEENVSKPCSNKFCELGCICDSLRCQKRLQQHCGDPACMISCRCEKNSWKNSLNSFSIFNIDHQHQRNLAIEEKGFKKTVIHNGSEVFVVDSNKKKRDIRLPKRFRDSAIWSEEINGFDEEKIKISTKNADKDPPDCTKYKNVMKPFCLDVPWYNIEGVSAWCMVHSCYDCLCFCDANSNEQGFEESIPLSSPINEDLSEVKDHIDAVDEVITQIPPLPDTLNDSRPFSNSPKIVHFNIYFNEPNSEEVPGFPKGKWILKHWIHNSDLHCSRTCGYELKNVVLKKVSKPLHQGYSLPPPRHPFVMGKTLKSNKRRCSSGNKDCLNKKAKFHDGLGTEVPSLVTSLSAFKNNLISTISNSDTTIDSPISDLASRAEQPYYFNNLNYVEKSTMPTNISSVESFVTNEEQEVQKCDNNSDRTVDIPIKKSFKLLSLDDMIKEEERRGELELDLSNTFLNRKMLVTESRFRKLINMNIIGVIGLNRQGRCIVNSVKSSEDLLKMQKIQLLISNNSIDVGPNMKEIFSPSNQAEGPKVRYVMISYNQFKNWEIIGIVQRKINTDSTSPKPKKPRMIPKNNVISISHLNSHVGSLDSVETSHDNTNPNKQNKDVIACPISESDKDHFKNISMATHENIFVTNRLENDLMKQLSQTACDDTVFPCKTYLLNQPSEKVFGIDSGSFNRPVSSNVADNSIGTQSCIKSTKSTTTSPNLINIENAISKSNETSFYLKKNELPILKPIKASMQTEVNSVELRSINISSTPNVSTNQTPLKLKLPTAKQVLTNNSGIVYIPGTLPGKQVFGLSNHLNMVDSNKVNTYSLSLKSDPSPCKPEPVLFKTSVLSTANSSLCYYPTPLKTKTEPAAKAQNPFTINLEFSSAQPKNRVSYLRPTPLNVKTSTDCSSVLKKNKVEPLSGSNSICKSSSSNYFTDLDLKFGYASPKPSKSNSICNNSLSSPEIKCLAVKSNENCTAVDLSINFRSIKLHWIMGAIKKHMLLHIYKVSKKSNIPISLYGRNEKMRVTFYGMHKTCSSAQPSSADIPVLILGSKVSSVLAAAKQDERELFRSNTIKYIIKDESGNINSFTYDAKGENLIRITSRLKIVNHINSGFASKVSVQEMRDLAEKDTKVLVTNMKPPEEITIDSDSDEEILKNQELSQEFLSFPSKLSPKESTNSASSNSQTKKSTNDSIRDLPTSYLSSSLIDVVSNKTNKESTSSLYSHSSDINSLQNCIENSAKLKFPLLKSPLKKAELLGEVESDIKSYMESIENHNENAGKILEGKEEFNDMENHDLKDIIASGSEMCSKGPQIDVKQIIANSSNGSFCSTAVQCKADLINKRLDFSVSEDLDINTPGRTKVNNLTDITLFPRSVTFGMDSSCQISSDVPQFNLAEDSVSSHLIPGDKEASSSLCESAKWNENCTKFVSSLKQVEADLCGKISAPTTKPVGDTAEFSTAKLVCSPSKQKCSIFTTMNSLSPLNRRDKEVTSNVSNIHAFGQEFQQIFSEAPQFWAMDNVERHNALERIRRKGLSKMFHNLYDAVKGTSQEKKLPPKHNVLQDAKNVIKDLKLEDTRLNQEEIQLRSKRMNLLNVLADVLKDMDEEIQKQMELWISQNVCNPTSKEDFEKSWKPSIIIFEDEPIRSSTVGDITLKGKDITSYFEAHTSGLNTVTCSPKTSPKKKCVQRFPLYQNRGGAKMKLGGFINLKRVSPKKLLKNVSKTEATSPVKNSSLLHMERSVVPPPILSNEEEYSEDCFLTKDESELLFHPL